MSFELLFGLWPHQSPLEFLVRTTRIMKPFLDDLGDDAYDIRQVLPDDAPSVKKFEALEFAAIASMEEMIQATRIAIADPEMGTSRVQVALWKFVLGQIEARSATVVEMSVTLQSGKAGDVNDALSQQSYIVRELTLLLGQFDEKGWKTGEEGSFLSIDNRTLAGMTTSAA